MKKHISFSEVKVWSECPFKHKLQYIDKVNKFVGNEYTAFGKALHEACEKSLLNDVAVISHVFTQSFLKELEKLKESSVELRPDLVMAMAQQGKMLADKVLPYVKEYFSNFEVHAAEEELYEVMPEMDYNFKGYIDLILKTKDGKYHIIDWKTCSWGWDSRRKADRITGYQLVFYKHFFAQKYNVDPKNIETYFALLKRTAKKNNIEIFKVGSGIKKTENSLKLLNNSIYNIKKGNYIKNLTSCTQGYGCEFYKTKHCP